MFLLWINCIPEVHHIFVIYFFSDSVYSHTTSTFPRKLYIVPSAHSVTEEILYGNHRKDIREKYRIISSECED